MPQAPFFAACLIALVVPRHAQQLPEKAGLCETKGNALLQMSNGQLSTLAASSGHSWVVQVGTGSDAGKSRAGITGDDLSLQRYFCPLGDLASCQPDPKHGVLLSKDSLRPCRTTVSNPIAKITLGSRLFVSWMGNGHVNNGQSNGTCVHLMLADFAKDPDFSAFTELPGGGCISYWNSDIDGVPRTSTWIEIPTSTTIGMHTLLWYWNFTDFWFSSCADIEVMPPDSGSTTPILPTATVTKMVAVPPGVSAQKVDDYMRRGCSADKVASTESSPDTFCKAYVGSSSYCKYWLTDDCGRSACYKGDFLLPCENFPSPEPEPEPEPSPTPSPPLSRCGDELCQSMRSGSWCRPSNGVCQWTNLPCKCELTSSPKPSTTPEPLAASSMTTTTTLATVYSSSTHVPSQHSDEDRYFAVEKTIYVWNTGDKGHHWWDWDAPKIELLLSVCRTHGFKRAIIFIGSVQWDWEQHFQANRLPHQERFVLLFAALRQIGVEPYAAFYLNDSPNNLTAWERAADVVSTLHRFNQAFPDSAVVGIDGDQEPTSIRDEYLNMLAAMKSRREVLNADLKLTAALKPGWLHRSYSGKPMADLALKGLDAGMIMAYSQSPDISTSWGEKALALAAANGQTLSVAIETSWRAPATDSFWEMASKDPNALLRLVAGMDARYRAGAHAHAYQGIVIHDYEGFFEAMYGTKATAYEASTVHRLYQK